MSEGTARTHTHRRAQSHGRRGNTRVKELMGSLGIAEIKRGGEGGASVRGTEEKGQACIVLFDLSRSVKGNLYVQQQKESSKIATCLSRRCTPLLQKVLYTQFYAVLSSRLSGACTHTRA